METLEELIEAGVNDKNCTVDEEYGNAFEEMIRTEFIKMLWHKDDVPEEGKVCLINHTKYSGYPYKIAYYNKTDEVFINSDYSIHKSDVIKWCYLDDILH